MWNCAALLFFFFKQKTAYEMRISDWSSDVCSSDLGEDEQVGPTDLAAVFLLHRPQQAARLVEIAVVGPTVERGEALLPGIRAAATVGGTISARAVPRHADEERTIMPIVGRPPRLDRKSTRLNSSH